MISSQDYFKSSHLVLKGEIPSGSITWQSPSNIALVKYWGKHGDQLANNPSISFTLTNAHTQTALTFGPRSVPVGGVSLSLLFDGEKKDSFEVRTKSYVEKLITIFPFIEQIHFDIRTRNSFPHSSGIASSASGMSALALCLCSLEHELFDTLDSDDLFRRKASFVARLGSGSACRSIYAEVALWGRTGSAEDSSDQYAIPFKEHLHESISNFRDAILIVNSKPKTTSSSSGHSMMETHPFATTRYESARKNLHQLIEALRIGDLMRIGQVCEHEALTLHALLMSSQPSILLIEPNTIKILQLIQEFRKTTNNPVFFTIDAGPNVHVLYPHHVAVEVESFIQDVLSVYCEDGAWINDQIGPGPIQM